MFQIDATYRVEKNYFRTIRRKTCFQLSLGNASMLMFIFFNITQISANHDNASAWFYLSQYGYLGPSFMNPHSGQLMSKETLSKAITQFQAFAGLNLTGYLDNSTLQMMSKPRCGFRDKFGAAEHSKSERYMLHGSRWQTNDLTYKISKYSRQLSQSQIDNDIQRALDMWSQVTPLKFRRVNSGPAQIDIRFETFEHRDMDPFDGPGGVLAHAYFPAYGGDVHFDDSEQWTVNSPYGTNFFQTAVHEFGHTLGLEHSNLLNAVMYPWASPYNPAFKLHSDDIRGIQELYGPNTGTSDTDDGENSSESGSGDSDPKSGLCANHSSRITNHDSNHFFRDS